MCYVSILKKDLTKKVKNLKCKIRGAIFSRKGNSTTSVCRNFEEVFDLPLET